jgi:formamidopyrimidine-DNA glycosylase
LKGRELERTRRHGKHLFARLSGDGWLRLHFGMTGFVEYYRGNGGKESDHVRLLLEFEDGYRLAYDCQRKLGEVGLVDDVEGFIEQRDLGPDPLAEDFDLERFRELLEGRRGSVKSALMNQSLMAGIGNVYSDETLFQAGIHPMTAVRDMEPSDLRRLHRAMDRVLRTAIERRVDPDDFPRSWLTPRRGARDRCPKCGGALASETIAGRTAWFCTDHQASGP